ncbi:hypothetical protein EDC94DRAFT_597265 [Helicostylum pulchrum]|nr:hypothetical protein EDC94DRAFT_597265 [Helicostylum pulchrum]
MDLPLYKLLIPPDENHWILKHKTFLSDKFFIFDIAQSSLRLRVAGEYTRYPRLCLQLYKYSLQTRIVKLHSSIWPYILEDMPFPVEWSSQSMVTNINSSTVWRQYSSQDLRQRIQPSSPFPVKFSSSIAKSLWTCQMYPNARTLYFCCLSDCIHTKKVLLKYGIVSSSTCSLCGRDTDNRRHFLKQVLRNYFPLVGLSADDIYKSIRHLKVPQGIRKAKKYFSTLSTTLHQLWIIYWQHGNDNLSTYPLSRIESSFLRIITHIERLLHPTQD